MMKYGEKRLQTYENGIQLLMYTLNIKKGTKMNLLEDPFYPYTEEQNLWGKFKQYVLPWLILAGICVGIYFILVNGLQFMIELSGPVSEGMKKVGL